MARLRLDVALREWGLAPSRAKAQELIGEEAVEYWNGADWVLASDESWMIGDNEQRNLRLKDKSALEYVSRGGRKLAGALDALSLDVKGLKILDIGISTGGFTDCVLKRGAALVVGVDVGKGQLADRLRHDSRLIHFEGVNARHLRAESRLASWLKEGFDLILIDVSFVSIRLILEEAVACLRPGGRLLGLVKPQFEVGAQNLDKRGVATDLELHEQVREAVKADMVKLGLTVRDDRPSGLIGQDGNQEYFIYATK